MALAPAVRNTWILYCIGATTAIIRLAGKICIAQRFELEEWIMVVALSFWTIQTALIEMTVVRGTNAVTDEERETMTKEDIRRHESGSQAFIAAWFVYITAIWLCKCAILQLQSRLFDRISQRRLVMIMRYVLLVSYSVCFLSLFLICHPFSHNWQVVPDPGRKCTSGIWYVLEAKVGAFNMATDLMLLALPLPALVKLNVSTGRKALLVGLFGLGVFVILATILRIYFTMASSSIANMTFWAEIETATLFVVANAPGIFAFFRYTKSKGGSSGQGLSNSYEMGGSKAGPNKGGVTIATLIEAGDSQERLANIENGVIHQDVNFEVTVDRRQSYRSSGPARSDISDKY